MTLKAEVAGLLQSDAVWANPHFGLSGQVICGCDLRVVGSLVRDGKIGIGTATGEGAGAWYHTGDNAFYFRFDSLTTITRKGLVVHESVHAALDYNKAKGMKVVDSEGIAYVHQCAYLLDHAKPVERLMGKNAKNDKVFAAAWSIAKTLREGKEPSNDQISKLRAGVRAHSNYEDEHDHNAGYNGIPNEA